MEHHQIPIELLETGLIAEDVSVIIGENGSGKSTLLNVLAKKHIRQNRQVLGIASSIHDKFNVNSPDFHVLRGRQGRGQARKTIKNAIKNIAKSDMQRLKNASRALKYVGFDPKLGFEIPEIKKENYKYLIEEDKKITQNDKDEILYLLERFKIKKRSELKNIERNELRKIEDFYQLDRIDKDNTYSLEKRPTRQIEKVWLEIDNFDFEAIQKFSLSRLFLWEATLRRLKIIDTIDVFLSKNNREISLLDASSGELSLITSIVYLTSIISENTTILIDEPENSLHPKWQKEYIKTLLDIFYLYQPKFIIATHSPIILNGAELFVENSKIFKSQNFEFIKQQKEPQNIEELYFDFFNITTPKNRFLSNILIAKLNQLAENEINKMDFLNFTQQVKNSIYDPKQQNLIIAIEKIAEKIN